MKAAEGKLTNQLGFLPTTNLTLVAWVVIQEKASNQSLVIWPLSPTHCPSTACIAAHSDPSEFGNMEAHSLRQSEMLQGMHKHAKYI